MQNVDFHTENSDRTMWQSATFKCNVTSLMQHCHYDSTSMLTTDFPCIVKSCCLYKTFVLISDLNEIRGNNATG